MKKAKKILACTFCLMVIMVVFAFAVDSESVDITSSDRVARSSGQVTAKSVVFSGNNNAISTRSLYVLPQYKNSNDNWVNGDATEMLIQPNFQFSDISCATTFTSNKYWRMELNPYGINTKGCTGSGTVTKLT